MTESFFPATITIDGTEVPIRVKRFDFQSREAFARDYNRMEGIQTRAAALTRLALMKADLPTKAEEAEAVIDPEAEGDRAARHARNAARLQRHQENVALALALRELEETPEERDKRERLTRINDEWAASFVRSTFANFVSIDPAFALNDRAGQPVRTGLELLDAYGSQLLYATVLFEVLTQNTLPTILLKKKSPSPSASDPLSPERSETSLTASGDGPGSAATAASTPASADRVAVMESR
jgi:hypothetical protein